MHNLPRVSDHLTEALQQGPKSLPFGTLVGLAVTTGLFSTAHRSVPSASAKGLEVAQNLHRPLHRRDGLNELGHNSIQSDTAPRRRTRRRTRP